MALQKQVVQLPFGAGISEDVDEKVLDAPLLARAHNCRFDVQGQVRKSRGTESMNGTALPATTSGLNAVFSHRHAPATLGRDGVHVWSPDRERWYQASTGKTPPVQVAPHGSLYSHGRIVVWDMAVNGGLVVDVWQVADGGQGEVWYRVRDQANLAILLPPTKSATLVGGPRVIPIGTEDFLVFGSDVGTPTTLAVAKIDVSAGLPHGATSAVKTDVDAWDVSGPAPTSGVWWAVTRESDVGTLTAHRGNSVGGVTASLVLTEIEGGDGCAILADPDNDIVFVAGCVAGDVSGVPVNATVDTEGTGEALFRIVGGTGTPAAAWSARVQITMGLRESGNGVVVAASAYSGEAAPQNNQTYNTVWRLCGPEIAPESNLYVQPNMLLAAKAFSPTNHGPVLVLEHFFTSDGSFTKQSAVLLVLIDETTTLSTVPTLVDGTTYGDAVVSGEVNGYPVVVARVFDDIAAGRNLTANFLPHCPSLQSSAAPWDHLVGTLVLTGTRQLEELRLARYRDPLAGFAPLQITPEQDVTDGKALVVSFDPPPVPVVSHNASTLVATGYLAAFDGTDYAEVVPHFAPELATAQPFFNNSDDIYQLGGLDPVFGQPAGGPGDYHCALVFVVEDANGVQHRSAPTLPIPVRDQALFAAGLDEVVTVDPVTGSPIDTDAIRVRYSAPPITHFSVERGQKMRVQLYLTEADSAGPYYFAKESEWVSDYGEGTTGAVQVPFPFSVGVLEYTGGEAEGETPIRTLTLAPTLYTTGGRLENRPPPSFRAMTATPTRVWGISAENPWELRASLLPSPLVATEWNPAVGIAAPSKYEFNAIAAIDEKVIVTTEENVFVVAGAGPDNLGRGAFSGPTLLSSDTGCLNPRSMVEGPFGVMFQGRRGFYVVDRGLSLQYVGGPVEVTLRDLVITCAVLVAEQHEVRFGVERTAGALTTMLVFNYRRGTWSTRDWQSDHAAVIDGRYHLAKNTASGYAVTAEREEDDDIHYDASLTSATMAMQVITAWIKLAGLQGYKRVWRVVLLGEYYDGDLRVEVGYDYDDAWVDTFDWVETTHLSPGKLQVSFRPTRSRCQSIRFRISERVTGTASLAEHGFSLSGLALEAGVKKGAARLPAGVRR